MGSLHGIKGGVGESVAAGGTPEEDTPFVCSCRLEGEDVFRDRHEAVLPLPRGCVGVGSFGEAAPGAGPVDVAVVHVVADRAAVDHRECSPLGIVVLGLGSVKHRHGLGKRRLDLVQIRLVGAVFRRPAPRTLFRSHPNVQPTSNQAPSVTREVTVTSWTCNLSPLVLRLFDLGGDACCCWDRDRRVCV